MWLLMLEAGFALFLLVFIVWWTMFAGRNPNSPPSQGQSAPKQDNGGESQPKSMQGARQR